MNVVKVEMNVPKQRKEKISSQEEKQKFIDKIVALKSENQQLLLQLRKEQTENSLLKSKLKKTNEDSKTRNAEINALRSKLLKESAQRTEVCARNELKISNLTHEKSILEARNKQLQRGLDQRKSANGNDNDADTDEYEVEKLIGHKMKNGVRFYLVRWKGYTDEDDTWERESNLNCPEILKSYNAFISK